MCDAKNVNNGNMDVAGPTMSDEEERQKLLSEVEELNREISRLRANIGVCRFGEIDFDKFDAYDRTRLPIDDEPFEIPDVEADIEEELFRLAGIYCSKFDDDYVFEFKPGNDVNDGRVYGVQILNVDGFGKLGQFVMPMGLDVRKIAEKYPIEDFRKVRPFLKSCKHHIECYVKREEQCLELKKILSNVKNCTLEWNVDYTIVWIQMFGIRTLDTADVYDETIYLTYKYEEIWPYKLSTESNVDELPHGLEKSFNEFFKPFKRMSLKDAFEQIAGNRSAIFSWTIINESSTIINVGSTDSDDSVDGFKFLKVYKKKKKGGGNRSVKNRTKTEETMESEKSLADLEKSAGNCEEDGSIENIEHRSVKDSKEKAKKLKENKKQTRLNFDVKTKEHKQVTFSKENDISLESVEDGGANCTADNFEQIRLSEMEENKAKQPKTTNLAKDTAVKKKKRADQLYEELREMKKQLLENNEYDETPDEFHENKRDNNNNKKKIQRKGTSRKQKYEAETESENENQLPNAETLRNERSASVKKRKKGTKEEKSPKGREEQIQIERSPNIEPTKNAGKAKARLEKRIYFDNEFSDNANEMNEQNGNINERNNDIEDEESLKRKHEKDQMESPSNVKPTKNTGKTKAKQKKRIRFNSEFNDSVDEMNEPNKSINKRKNDTEEESPKERYEKDQIESLPNLKPTKNTGKTKGRQKKRIRFNGDFSDSADETNEQNGSVNKRNNDTENEKSLKRRHEKEQIEPSDVKPTKNLGKAKAKQKKRIHFNGEFSDSADEMNGQNGNINQHSNDIEDEKSMKKRHEKDQSELPFDAEPTKKTKKAKPKKKIRVDKEYNDNADDMNEQNGSTNKRKNGIQRKESPERKQEQIHIDLTKNVGKTKVRPKKQTPVDSEFSDNADEMKEYNESINKHKNDTEEENSPKTRHEEVQMAPRSNVKATKDIGKTKAGRKKRIRPDSEFGDDANEMKEHNKSLNKRKNDAEKEKLPERRQEKVQIKPPPNVEPTKNTRKTKVRPRRIRVDKKMNRNVDKTEESETSAAMTDAEDKINDHVASDVNKFKEKVDVLKGQKKSYSILMTSENANSKTARSNVKGPQNVKGKKPMLGGEAGNEGKKRIERHEANDAKIVRDEEPQSQKFRELNRTPNLNVNALSATVGRQSVSQKRMKVGSRLNKRLEQIRERNVVGGELINSTPIFGRMLNQVSFSEIAEISNIDSSRGEDKDKKFLDRDAEKQTLKENQKKRKALEAGARGQKNSRGSDGAEFSSENEINEEKENNKFDENKNKRRKSVEKSGVIKKRGNVKGIRDVNNGWDKFVDADSSGYDPSDEDLLKDRELLRDLAHIKENNELIPAMKQRTKANKKRLKK